MVKKGTESSQSQNSHDQSNHSESPQKAKITEPSNMPPLPPMVHKFVLKRFSKRKNTITTNTTNSSSSNSMFVTEEELHEHDEIIDEDEDESDVFELEEGENWLRLVHKEAGHHSILDDTQDMTQDTGTVYPTILSLASLGEGITISKDCYVCLDVDGPTLTVKDMRLPLSTSGRGRNGNGKYTKTRNHGRIDDDDEEDDDDDEEDESLSKPTSHLGIARKKIQSTPTDEDCDASIPYQWELLKRRQMRVLHPGDSLCTSFNTATGTIEGGLILEYQYQQKIVKQQIEDSQKGSLGLLTQPMDDDDDEVDGSQNENQREKVSMDITGNDTQTQPLGTQSSVSKAGDDETDFTPPTIAAKPSIQIEPNETSRPEQTAVEDDDMTQEMSHVSTPPPPASPQVQTMSLSTQPMANDEGDPTADSNPKNTKVAQPLIIQVPKAVDDGPAPSENDKNLTPKISNGDNLPEPQKHKICTNQENPKADLLHTKTETKQVPTIQTSTNKPDDEHHQKPSTAEKVDVNPSATKETDENLPSRKAGNAANTTPKSTKLTQAANAGTPLLDDQFIKCSTAPVPKVLCRDAEDGGPLLPESAITLSPALVRVAESRNLLYPPSQEEVSISMIRETGEQTLLDTASAQRTKRPNDDDDGSELTDIDEPPRDKDSGYMSRIPRDTMGSTSLDNDDADSEITDLEVRPSDPRSPKEISEQQISDTANKGKVGSDDDQSATQIVPMPIEVGEATKPDADPDAKRDYAVCSSSQGANHKENVSKAEPPQVNTDVQVLEQEEVETENNGRRKSKRLRRAAKIETINPLDKEPTGVGVASTTEETGSTGLQNTSMVQCDSTKLNSSPPLEIEKASRHGGKLEGEKSLEMQIGDMSTPASGIRSRRGRRKAAKASPSETLDEVAELKYENIGLENSDFNTAAKNETKPSPPTRRASKRARESSVAMVAPEPTPSTKRPRGRGRSITTGKRQSISDASETEAKNRADDNSRTEIQQPVIRVMATGVAFDAKRKNMVKRIGGIFLEKVQDAATATHLVAASDDVRLKRTPKLMIALCRTGNIVHLDWLEQSAVKREALEVTNFLLINEKEAEIQYNFSMPETLQRAHEMRENGKSLFEGCGFYLCAGVAGSRAADNRTPPEEDFRLILEAAGGTVFKSLPTTKRSNFDSFLIVVSKLGKEAKKQLSMKKVAEAVQKGAIPKTTEEIFHAIMTQTF